MFNYEQWDGFEGRLWKEEINTRDFIQKNYTPYDGDSSFLAGPTEATDKLWGILQGLQKEERAKGGVLDMDTDIVSGITSHGPGYISGRDKGLRADRWSADRQAIKESIHALRWYPYGRGSLQELWLRAKPRASQDLH